MPGIYGNFLVDKAGISLTPSQYLRVADEMARYNGDDADEWASHVDILWYPTHIRRYCDTVKKVNATRFDDLTYSKTRADNSPPSCSHFDVITVHLAPASLTTSSFPEKVRPSISLTANLMSCYYEVFKTLSTYTRRACYTDHYPKHFTPHNTSLATVSMQAISVLDSVIVGQNKNGGIERMMARIAELEVRELRRRLLKTLKRQGVPQNLLQEQPDITLRERYPRAYLNSNPKESYRDRRKE